MKDYLEKCKLSELRDILKPLHLLSGKQFSASDIVESKGHIDALKYMRADIITQVRYLLNYSEIDAYNHLYVFSLYHNLEACIRDNRDEEGDEINVIETFLAKHPDIMLLPLRTVKHHGLIMYVCTKPLSELVNSKFYSRKIRCLYKGLSIWEITRFVFLGGNTAWVNSEKVSSYDNLYVEDIS